MRRVQRRDVLILMVLVGVVASTMASGSGTYAPPVPPRLNNKFLAGEKLWKSRSIVGPGGKTCAACHDNRRRHPLNRTDLLRKKEDLAKLIYFEMVDKSNNIVIRPNDPQVRALEEFMVAKYQLKAKNASLKSEEAQLLLKTARDAYLAGDYGEAVNRLDGLLLNKLPDATASEAFLLRGLIAYVLGDVGKASEDFYQVFRLTPDARLDPEVFSPKVIEFFEAVRGEAGVSKRGRRRRGG